MKKETKPGTKKTAPAANKIVIAKRGIRNKETNTLITAEENNALKLQAFATVLELIAEKGIGVNKAIKQTENINITTFYNIVDSSPTHLERYTRATVQRTDAIAERMIRSAHKANNDFYTDENGNKRPNPVAVQRARLQMDADKWLISKLNPKKYGDKLNIDATLRPGEPLTLDQATNLLNEISKEE
jgi:hypothetical protein